MSEAGDGKRSASGLTCRTPSKKQTLHPPFLSDRNETRPLLCILLTPLRNNQQNILTQNLLQAGARLLPPDQLVIHQCHLSDSSHVLIVTDNVSKAQSRISPLFLQHHNVQFISVKWATALLAAQKWLSFHSYILQHPATTFPPETPPQPNITHSTLPPVWSTSPVHQYSEIAEKKRFFKQLPSFQCQRCTITHTIYKSPNFELCQLLEDIARKRRLEQAGGSEHTADIHARAYQRASAALKCVPFKLNTVQDAQSLTCFGSKVQALFTEYLNTGTIKEASALKTDKRLITLARFQHLYGIGYITARRLYDEQNVRNITDLQTYIETNSSQFNQSFLKYIKHYDCLEAITLENATAFKKQVEKIANDKNSNNLALRFVICGGLRRGERTGHDIDLLYCRRKPYTNDHTSVLQTLVNRLVAHGLLKDTLHMQSDGHGWREIGYTKQKVITNYEIAHDVVHAIGYYNGKTFRIDMIGVRIAEEFSFATLAWSGSLSFQRDIREWCERKHGWIFNQHGLFDRTNGNRACLEPQPRSEMDIFSAMQLTYRAPFERSC